MVDSQKGALRPALLGVLIVLIVLILLAFGLRMINLDAFSFWTDEGLTPERAGYSLVQILRNEIVIQGVVTKDTHPPLYYLIIHFTGRLFGESDFAFRYPSVLFGILLVPVIYQLGRRLETVGLGLLVALLVTVNPLQIYYAQEARMYTLLVLLGATTSYILWRALSQPNLTRNQLIRYLLLYGLLAALTVYTHYTAVFLIGAQALLWAWLLWQRGYKRLILGAALVAILAAIPLIPYTVPRLFTGAEANYTYVSPQVMLQDVVHFFNLGVTTDFRLLTIKILDVVVLALMLAGLWAARPWTKRWFLLSYLLAVVLGLMAGSLIKPMYQGVRHIMLGSPALLLLVGYGIWWLWGWIPGRRHQTTGGPLFNPLGAVALGLVLLGSTVALFNLYFNPSYAKDDFRDIVRFVEQRAGEHDIVVYNNAVLLPLHNHYRIRPDIDVTALPVYPQLATGAEPDLDRLAQAYDRIWFITDPPADKRDDNKLIQGWLEENQTEVSNQLFPARTTEARVITYAGGRRHPTELDPGAQPLDIQWAGWPALVGSTVDETQPVSAPTLWIDLFWKGNRPGGNDGVRFELIGPDGDAWLVEGRALLQDEDEPWSTDKLNRLSYDLPLPVGLPPATYTLLLHPEDEDGRPLASAEEILQVEIAGTDSWAVSPEELYGQEELAGVMGQPAIQFENGLALQDAVIWDQEVRPGNNLPLTLFWRTGDEPIQTADLLYRLEVIGPDGELFRWQEDPPGASWLESAPENAFMRENASLYFRPDAEPGQYTLRWQLRDNDAIVGGRSFVRPWPADSVVYGTVNVVPWPLETRPPADVSIRQASFGPSIRLYGIRGSDGSEGSLPLTLVWQAVSEPESNYVVFVHLISEETGEIISQIDSVPVGGMRPTNGWREDEIILDPYNLNLPSDLEPGWYRINVGLYDPDSGQRLPVFYQDTAQPDSQLTLTTFEVTAGE